MQVKALNHSSVEASWLPPETSAQIDSYELSAKEIKKPKNDALPFVFYDTVSGNEFSYVFNYLSPLSTYNITVKAISNEWSNCFFLIIIRKQ